MRVILRYVQGRPEWSDNVPSYARLSGFGGRSIEEAPVRRRSEDYTERARRGWETRRDADDELPSKPSKLVELRRSRKERRDRATASFLARRDAEHPE